MRTGPNKVEIDGAIMIVCSGCAKLGRAVGGADREGDARPARSRRASGRRRRWLSRPEYEIDPDYNVKIRQAREKMGLSQEDLGRMLNEKPSVIRMVESKKLKPDAVLTRKLTHHLKVNLLVPLSELEGGSWASEIAQEPRSIPGLCTGEVTFERREEHQGPQDRAQVRQGLQDAHPPLPRLPRPRGGGDLPRGDRRRAPRGHAGGQRGVGRRLPGPARSPRGSPRSPRRRRRGGPWSISRCTACRSRTRSRS